MAYGHITSIRLPAIGVVWIARTSRGIARVCLRQTKRAFLAELPAGIEWIEDAVPFARIRCQLLSLAQGKPSSKRHPLDLCGTPFQMRVWRAIATIPHGQMRSYAWLARATGKPRAIRAAANACGANPVPLLIPCHRVIASDGSLGGFSSGVALKRRLLVLEGEKIGVRL